MTHASTYLRIPRERVGVLIGPDGVTKKNIEEKLAVKLEIESDSGGVTIAMAEEAKDPSMLFRAKDVVTALGRGFSPEHAFRLTRDEESILDIMDLRITFGKSETDIKRVKGRIIGMNGKTRQIIEELTDVNLSVYGHTIGIMPGQAPFDFGGNLDLGTDRKGNPADGMGGQIGVAAVEGDAAHVDLWCKVHTAGHAPVAGVFSVVLVAILVPVAGKVGIEVVGRRFSVLRFSASGPAHLHRHRLRAAHGTGQGAHSPLERSARHRGDSSAHGWRAVRLAAA